MYCVQDEQSDEPQVYADLHHSIVSPLLVKPVRYATLKKQNDFLRCLQVEPVSLQYAIQTDNAHCETYAKVARELGTYSTARFPGLFFVDTVSSLLIL